MAKRWLVAKTERNGKSGTRKPQRPQSRWQAFKLRSYPATIGVPAKLARSHLSKVIFTLSVVNEVHMDGVCHARSTPTITQHLLNALKGNRKQKRKVERKNFKVEGSNFYRTCVLLAASVHGSGKFSQSLPAPPVLLGRAFNNKADWRHTDRHVHTSASSATHI